ncbi:MULTISPECIES: hypothetical protein [unclassified Amycolatopsis]|uniref:hypothetical protein n=1 Tax=unclassified Amycolatopsis TaxID=2618356 RepID=UPI001F0E28F2|nr:MULTISPECIES: hypothetical protein [unclassified Amycolatopsis]
MLDHAKRLRGDGRAPGDDPLTRQARAMKDELCAVRAEEASSYVSRSFYRNGW